MASIIETLKIIMEEPTGVVSIPKKEGDTEYALEIELPAYYEWIWLLSYGESIVYAGTSYNIMRIENLSETGGTINGVTKIPFFTATRIRGDLSKKFYLRNSSASNGNVQIIAQNCESCPFGSCSF